MGNPFASRTTNNIILIVCYAFGVYVASKENHLSLFGILFLGAIVGVVIYFVIKILFFMLLGTVHREYNPSEFYPVVETEEDVLKSRMLIIMQHGHHNGIKGALKEFNEIFANYPQYELEHWEVFRAWYKDMIDYLVAHPDIYTLTNKVDGSEYCKDSDPLYDPNAPDWELYDAPMYDDKDDDIDEDALYRFPETLNDRLRRPFGSGF